MTDDRTRHWIDALERAAAQLEIALRADEDWRALRLATSRTSRVAHERALSGNPVYRAWDLLSHALMEMHAAGDGSEPTARRSTRVELRDVLEHIRQDAALGGHKAAAVACDRGRTEPAATGRPGLPSGTGDDAPCLPPAARPTIALDEEEATVSFVIREPGLSGRADPAPAERDPGQAQPPSEAAGLDATIDPQDDQGAEVQVVIVPRSR